MTLFIQLIIAHLIGDFIFQPAYMVADKKKRKLRSYWLYIHCAIHGLLVLIFTGNSLFWPWALLIAGMHLLIDAAKITFTVQENERRLFFLDQLLHLSVLSGVVLWHQPEITTLFSSWIQQENMLLLTGCIVFLSTPVSVVTKVIISKWTPAIGSDKSSPEGDSLMNAGKYIGILERLFVFCFIISDHFEAIGFLLAAKSIFRFGDLRESNDRKLTEYVLIGTLVSFGIAMLTGWLYLRLQVTGASF